MTDEDPPEQDLAPATTCIYLLVHRHAPVTPTRLADLSGYSRQWVHRCLADLDAEDLVTADSNPADRRQTRYTPADT